MFAACWLGLGYSGGRGIKNSFASPEAHMRLTQSVHL